MFVGKSVEMQRLLTLKVGLDDPGSLAGEVIGVLKGCTRHEANICMRTVTHSLVSQHHVVLSSPLPLSSMHPYTKQWPTRLLQRLPYTNAKSTPSPTSQPLLSQQSSLQRHSVNIPSCATQQMAPSGTTGPLRPALVPSYDSRTPAIPLNSG